MSSSTLNSILTNLTRAINTYSPRTLPQRSYTRRYNNFHSNSIKHNNTNKGQMPETFVQLLPVVLPKPSHPRGKILLCKWTSGVFEDRYTGMIKSLEMSQFPISESPPVPLNLRESLTSEAEKLVPPSLRNNLDKIELVGVLRFDGPPDCYEYVFLGSILKDIDDEVMKGGVMNGDHPCFWFDWDKIPFDQMPADDAIWYPRVLGDGGKVRGFFNFGGWSERTIKSYELSTVEKL